LHSDDFRALFDNMIMQSPAFDENEHKERKRLPTVDINMFARADTMVIKITIGSPNDWFSISLWKSFFTKLNAIPYGFTPSLNFTSQVCWYLPANGSARQTIPVSPYSIRHYITAVTNFSSIITCQLYFLRLYYIQWSCNVIPRTFCATYLIPAFQ